MVAVDMNRFPADLDVVVAVAWEDSEHEEVVGLYHDSHEQQQLLLLLLFLPLSVAIPMSCL